jgi:hypothetical protein
MNLAEARASGLPIVTGATDEDGAITPPAAPMEYAQEPKDEAEHVSPTAAPPPTTAAMEESETEQEVTEDELLALSERIGRLERLLKKSVTVAKLNKRMDALEAWLKSNT